MTDDLADALRAVGDTLDLTEYEVQTYVTVVEQGRVTPREIASSTDIPQPRVYDTVRRLADRNLVELRETRPMEIIPLPPTDAFEAIQSELDTVVSGLEASYSTPKTDDQAAFLVRSRGSILRYIADIIQEAETEITLALTPGLLDRYADALRAADERDVTTTVLIAPISDAPAAAEYPYEELATEIRGRRGVTTPIIAVADWSYGIYTVPRAVTSNGSGYGVIFNRSSLGFLVLGFFGTVLWSTADHAIYERDQPVTFPRTYGSIRRCIKDVRRSNSRLFAEVTGRDVTTGAQRTVAGRIVETTITPDEAVATMVVDTGDDRVEIGGLTATYEDIEAREITVTRRR